jgi:hypothetical protein
VLKTHNRTGLFADAPQIHLRPVSYYHFPAAPETHTTKQRSVAGAVAAMEVLLEEDEEPKAILVADSLLRSKNNGFAINIKYDQV